MKEIRFNNQKDLVLTTMIDRLEFFEKQIIPLEKEIKNNAKESEDMMLWIRLRSDNKRMEKHSYRGRVKGVGVFNLFPIPEVTIW